MNLRELDRRRVLAIVEPVFEVMGKTNSNSASWAFDRFRLYTADSNTYVQIKDHNGTIIGEQLFHSGGGWTTNKFEHDFLFDLSGNTGNHEWEILIKGIPPSAKFKQIYSNPTGFGSTRGKDADLTYWNLDKANPINDSTTEAYLRLENQPLTLLDGALNVKAKYIYVQNTLLSPSNIDDLIIGADNYGITGGTLNYNGLSPTSASKAAYDNLIAKSWTITGAVPTEEPATAWEDVVVADYKLRVENNYGVLEDEAALLNWLKS
jgi:hypothetical protein